MTTTATAELVLKIRAIGTEAVKGVNTELAKLRGTGKEAAKGFDLAAKLQLASQAAKELRNQLMGAIKLPLDSFADFEAQMARVAAKSDGITTGQFARLKEAAEQIGATTQFTAQEAAKGLEELASAGLSADQQLGALRPTILLTQAGGLELGETTNILTSTMNQFGLSVRDMPHIADTLTAGFNASAVELADLAETLKYVGPVAHAAGMGLEATTTYAALLGNAGIKGSQAGTSLNAIMGRMAFVVKRGSSALSELGLTAKDAAKGVSQPISFLTKLNEKFDKKHYDNAKRLGALIRIFGQEAAPSVAALLSKAAEIDPKTGKTGFQTIEQAVKSADGATEHFAKVVADTTKGDTLKLAAQFHALQLEIGEAFSPAVREMLAQLRPLIKSIGDWVKENPRLVATIGRAALELVVFLSAVTVAAKAVATFQLVSRGLTPVLTLLRGALGATAGGLQGLGVAMGGGLMATVAVWTAGIGLAAGAGWGFGRMLDNAIGKLLGLRGGLLSTEAALNAGESEGFNNTIENIGKTFHIQTLVDAAQGNKLRNSDEDQASLGGRLRSARAKEKEDKEARATSAPAESLHKVEVEITDKRPKVTIRESRGPAQLRVGTNVSP